MRPGDLVLVIQKRTGDTELMVCVDPGLLPGRIFVGPCTYSIFLNMEGKLEEVLNDIHTYELVQSLPDR